MRRRTTFLVGGAVAVALALGGLVGGVLAEPSSSVSPTVAPRALSDRALAGAAGGVTASTVAELEADARARPGDAGLLTQLGFAYQLRWRETADASFLPRSKTALRRALRADPHEPNAVLGLGSLALIRHEFRAALAYGRRAQRLLAGSGRPYGVTGDALVELGRYDEAFQAFQRMVSLRPGLASYARVAYARELTGDLEGALAAMRLAFDTAAGQPEPTAFTLVEIAKLEQSLRRPRAALAHIRHEFRAALANGRRAQRSLAGSGRPYGVIGDALVELGRYDEAFQAFQRMVSLRPGLASYARVAYARELTGDLEGALAAMRLAFDTAAGQPEPTAFTLVEIAKLEQSLRRPRAALAHVRAALRVLPGYPAARLELARIEAGRGRIQQAISEARRAAEAVPTPESVGLLADLLERAGRKTEARRQRATVAVIERLLEANGVQVDLESAVYRADERIRPRETVHLARRARATRPSIYGDDALAWALARAGRCEEALSLAKRSLRLGTKDPLLYFHRGYAEGCAGNRAARREWYGRALALDPEFSVRWAPVARAATAGT